MPSMRLVSGSKGLRALSSLPAGARGTVQRVQPHAGDRLDRLVALGVTTLAPAVVYAASMPDERPCVASKRLVTTTNSAIASML